MDMISIVVPFWNSEKWLGRCCESLHRQEGDFLFLLIDDHSTDNGKEIAYEYCMKDQRFRLLTQVHSKGVSGARNTGIDYAVQSSDWVTFLDADDELLDGAYRAFTRAIKADPKANMHQFNHMRYYTAIDKLTLKYTNESGVYKFSDLPNMWFSVWNTLYKADFIKDIRFDEDLQYGEDGMFNIECFIKDNYLHHVEMTTVKHRFDNKDSLSKTKTPEDIFKYIQKYEDVYARLTDKDMKTALATVIGDLWTVRMVKAINGQV